MKNKTHQFDLINNTYSASDAREVITSLINDKIRFLNVQILGLQERFGQDTSHLEKRVKELQADRNRVIEVLSKAMEDGADIEISSQIDLTVKTPAEIAL